MKTASFFLKKRLEINNYPQSIFNFTNIFVHVNACIWWILWFKKWSKNLQMFGERALPIQGRYLSISMLQILLESSPLINFSAYFFPFCPLWTNAFSEMFTILSLFYNKDEYIVKKTLKK